MNKIYCSNCGQLVAGAANFCTFCGAPQHGQAAAAFRARDAPVENPEQLSKDAHDIVPIPKTHLDGRAIWVFFLSYFGKTSILVPAILVGVYFNPMIFGAILVAVIATMLLTAMLVYNNFMYEIDQTGLIIESGIIHKKQVSVPFEQVQNVNIERSIIDRLFGLARLSIETAGASSNNPQTVAGFNGAVKSEAYLPGIDLEHSKVIHDTLIDGASDAV
jgi:membrane protein YdbS with pleckstrin-like domain